MDCQYTGAAEVRRKKEFVIHVGSSRISDFLLQTVVFIVLVVVGIFYKMKVPSHI